MIVECTSSSAANGSNHVLLTAFSSASLCKTMHTPPSCKHAYSKTIMSNTAVYTRFDKAALSLTNHASLKHNDAAYSLVWQLAVVALLNTAVQ
jgi:hypothetical protein